MSNITVDNITRRINVSQNNLAVNIKNVERKVSVYTVGRQGPQGVQGIQGEAGEGLPTGGTTGEFLVKQTDQDYDYEWQGVAPTGDKNFVQAFTNSSVVTVTHNLNKYPSIIVTDSTGDEVEGEVEHLSINQLVARFSGSFTGQIICN